MMPISERKHIAQYRLLHSLARGGMSEVYLALDTRTGSQVALKLVDRQQRYHCSQLQREIEVFQSLQHDHILPIFDHGEDDCYCYIAMPYIAAGTLRNRIAQGHLDTREAGAILLQLAQALQFAHEHGVIHGDIKPSNILLRDGQHVYLTDFGLVTLQEVQEDDCTQVLALAGTPAYMAPELAAHSPSVQSDIYAVGVVLYQMLTGRAPFKSSTALGYYWQHLHAQPAPPSSLNPAIPSSIDQVVLRALEKEPEKRFQTVRDLAQAYIDAFVSERRIRAEQVGSRQRGGLIRRRTFASATVAAGFFCVFPTALGFSFYSMLNQEAPGTTHGGPHTLQAQPARQYNPTLSNHTSDQISGSKANRAPVISSDGSETPPVAPASQRYPAVGGNSDTPGDPPPRKIHGDKSLSDSEDAKFERDGQGGGAGSGAQQGQKGHGGKGGHGGNGGQSGDQGGNGGQSGGHGDDQGGNGGQSGGHGGNGGQGGNGGHGGGQGGNGGQSGGHGGKGGQSGGKGKHSKKGESTD